MENREIEHTGKKCMVTDIKNTDYSLLISQRMHENKKVHFN